MPAIFGFGLLTLDTFYTVRHFPRADEKLQAQEKICAPGGPVPAALGYCARSGAETFLAAETGDDAAGRDLQDRLKNHGMDTSNIFTVSGRVTDSAVIITEKPGGRRTVILDPDNTAAASEPAIFDIFSDQMTEGDILLLDARNDRTCRYLAAKAREKGCTVMLDPGARTLDLCVWEDLTDILIASKDFILKNYGEMDLFQAVKILGDGKIRHIALTLGAGGVLWYDGSAPQFIPARKVPSVDTNGAGDVFHGACALALLEGRSFSEALREAADAAAYSTLFTGVFYQEINRDNVNKYFSEH